MDGLNRDATIYSSAMFSLRGRTIPAPSGWTKSFRGPIGGHRSCGFFACKERAELDRLLQRNQSGGFTSGTQLYDYLKAHKCVGLTAGRARVYSSRSQYVCIYDPKDNKINIYPCAWTRTEMEWVLLISFPDNIGGNPSVVGGAPKKMDFFSPPPSAQRYVM